MKEYIKVIGGGLSGCEAAYQIAKRGIKVKLYDCKNIVKREPYTSDKLGELVCSNSFRGKAFENGVGLLKEELSKLGSIFMEGANNCEVEAGGALAVNREDFSSYLTRVIKEHPLIEYIEEEICKIDEDEYTIIATGPMSTGCIYDEINKLCGEENSYFYDAAAPIVSGDSIDYSKAFFKSRYDKGSGKDYLNCPLTREEYDVFYKNLIGGRRKIPRLGEEKEKYFDGCMPIEVLASRGEKTILFGPLKPVGLEGVNGEKYYGVVQLRKENEAGSMYNLVGFQTGLDYNSQKEVIRSIPGLEKAEILRFGVMHRNTYINGPKLLSETYSLRNHPKIFIAGQISGVEGYVESAASGFVAGVNCARNFLGKKNYIFKKELMIGAMANYVSTFEGKNFQPMNANFGLLPSLSTRYKDKKLRKEMLIKRAILNLELTIGEKI